MAVFGLFFLLIPLTILLACVVGLVYVWVRVLRTPRESAPTCGKCGYLVRGGTTLQCPECGADYREVGIDTAKQRGAIHPLAFVLAWTLLFPLPAFTAAGLLIAFGPTESITRHNLTLTPVNNTSHFTLSISNSYGGSPFVPPWSVAPASVAVDVTLNSSGPVTHFGMMQVDLVGMTFTSPYGAQPGVVTPLTEAEVLAWMGSAGLPTTDPDVQAQARELFQVLQQTKASALASVASTSVYNVQNHSWAHDEPHRWWVVAVVLFFLALWIAGFILFARIRRNQRRRWAAIHQPTPPLATGGATAAT